MRKKIPYPALFFSGFFLLFFPGVFSQNIPIVGTADHLEIANWNIEWFGNTSNGPTDENLQKKNVLSVLKNTNMDIWGLCEVSNASAWDSLKANLPDYSGVISTWSQTQKTAFLYKKSTCTLVRSGNILSGYYKEFANGRTPLQSTFVYINNGRSDTVTLILVHLKSNVGVDTAKLNSYNNRKSSGVILKSYLDTFSKNKNVMVLGDWNDDLDLSVYNNLQSPFDNILTDSADYFFPTYKLSLNGTASTVSFPSFIDHQCMNRKMRSAFMKDSCKVLKADQWITSYASNTTDHYPVYSVFDFKYLYVQRYMREDAVIFFNGTHFECKQSLPTARFAVFGMNGNLLWEGRSLAEYKPESGGIYLVRIQKDGKNSWQKIEVIK